uniref:Immunoglobulin domain-containing protein n=1 Tax=Chrysemys picta bellii TaxID=8478 RepID=A0A8C3HJ92_CHRPI
MSCCLINCTWACVSPSHSCLSVNAELPAPGPSISVSPSGVFAPGGAVTICCQCRCGGRRLLLYKGGIEIRELDAAGDRGEFIIPGARWEDRGAYACRSRSRLEPPNWLYPSEMVRIIVADEGPGSVSLLPAPCPDRPSWGSLVTIRCRNQHLGMRFFLYKAGDGNYLTYTDPAGSEAEFPITSARREHGGSYTCRYSNRTVRAAYSEPSDPVQIIVAGEGPSLAPRGRVTLWGAVTIRCECRCAGTRVLLSKAGDPNAQRSMDSVGDVVEFPIRNVSRGDVGSYSCRYRTKWDPPVWSEPSDPVELIVTGEGPRSSSPFPAPHPAGLSAHVDSDGTLRARLCPESWAQQRGHPDGEWGQSHWGPRTPSFELGILYHLPQAPPLSIVFCPGKQGRLGFLSSKPSFAPLWLEPAGQVTGVLSSYPSFVPHWLEPADCQAGVGGFLISRLPDDRVPHLQAIVCGSQLPGDHARICVSRPVSTYLQSPATRNPSSPCTPVGRSSWGEP